MQTETLTESTQQSSWSYN